MDDSFLLSIIVIILIIFIVVSIINSVDVTPQQHQYVYEKLPPPKKPVNILEELMNKLDSIDKKLDKTTST